MDENKSTASFADFLRSTGTAFIGWASCIEQLKEAKTTGYALLVAKQEAQDRNTEFAARIVNQSACIEKQGKLIRKLRAKR